MTRPGLTARERLMVARFQLFALTQLVIAHMEALVAGL